MNYEKTYRCNCGNQSLYKDQCSDCIDINFQKNLDRKRSKREDIEDVNHDFVTVGCTDHRYCIKCNEEDHVIKSTMMRCSELGL